MIKLSNEQRCMIESIHKRFSITDIETFMDIWLPLVDSKVLMQGSSGPGVAFDLGKTFHGWPRNDVYNTVVNYIRNTTYVTVAIPSGDGFYITVCRSVSGNLVISDKRYQSFNTIKRHNSNVPGGLTFEELSDSPLRWVLQFAEVVND